MINFSLEMFLCTLNLPWYIIHHGLCIFCEISANRIVDQNELCFVIRDGYPVTKLHSLIIPSDSLLNWRS